MVKRKQCIYLFFAAIVSGISVWVTNLWKSATEWVQAQDDLVVLLLFIISSLLSLATIFLFKNRILQMRIGSLNILLNILLIGCLAYSLSSLSVWFSVSVSGIGIFIPFV